MKILLIEDDARLRAQAAQALESAGFLVDATGDGEEAEFMGSTETYAAAVLDLGLPGMNGIDILDRWRGAGIDMPVLILTARGDWTDKIAGFRAGADDYVVKPARVEEVVVRVQTLVRRAAGHARVEIRAGDLVLDTQTTLFTLAGTALRLTAFEHRLLSLLIHRKGQIVSRTTMSEHLYDSAADRDFRSLEVMIGRLRRKLGPDRIETVRGEGYRLGDPAA